MTINRNPFQVPIPRDKSGIFNQVDFKGICDNKNDVTIEQMSFADALNVYVDEGNVLTSRPPLKFSDNEKYILKQWMFGDIGLRLRRSESEDTFTFAIECYTHEVAGEVKITKPVEVGYDYEPATKLIQIEDKIYIWLTDTVFWCLNIATMTFEDARKYLYLPVHKQVFNGIESDLEDKNFLTDTYRKRHQYNAVSSINFEKLIGKKMQVGLIDTAATSAESHLYDITIQKNQEKVLIYPHAAIGDNYHVDIVQTPRATVTLRYAAATKSIEVSLDSKIYRPVVAPEGIIGNPQLTKDGMWIVAFTNKGLAKCKIVASETADFLEPERVLSWTVEPYLKHEYSSYTGIIDSEFVPVGYFETIDIFAYVFRGSFPTGSPVCVRTCLAVQWLSGAKEKISGYTFLDTQDDPYSSPEPYVSNDIKLHFKYTFGALQTVCILSPKHGIISGDYTFWFFFDEGLANTATLIRRSPSPIGWGTTFGLPCKRMDLHIASVETIKNFDNSIKYHIYKLRIAYRLLTDEEYITEMIYNYWPNPIDDTNSSDSYELTQSGPSLYFRLQPGTKNVITDKYVCIDGSVITLPDNGELYDKDVIPLNIDSNGVWYNVDGMLWTSQLSSSKSFILDEYINAEIENIGEDGDTIWSPTNIDLKAEMPRYNATLDEHYMSFTTKDGLNLLQVTSAKRDGTLYLPKINEQKFSKPITNLHVLSENEVGVFTQDEIWYIRRTGAGYTKPIKSKIPAGCRDGSDIITALDGKIIIFTTQRGVAALSPQDFIASTEQTLTYLSDNIQSLYYSFYNDRVHSIKFLPYEFEKSFDPMIKIVTYKYWIIFHKYMDRTVLAFDTRTSVWWKWKSSYPIKSMIANMRLHFLMEVDFNPVKEVALYYPTQENSYLGMDFLWADREVNSVTYEDDVIEDSLNGYSELIENHRVLHYADPQIYWSLTSQRLHFGKINNYKNIKAINIIAKGEGTQTAKLTTKVYRDFYHPERSEVMEISINDLVTFVRRMNLMHVMNFQYMLSADTGNEQQSQIKIDNIGIKYEVKEGI